MLKFAILISFINNKHYMKSHRTNNRVTVMKIIDIMKPPREVVRGKVVLYFDQVKASQFYSCHKITTKFPKYNVHDLMVNSYFNGFHRWYTPSNRSKPSCRYTT